MQMLFILDIFKFFSWNKIKDNETFVRNERKIKKSEYDFILVSNIVILIEALFILSLFKFSFETYQG